MNSLLKSADRFVERVILSCVNTRSCNLIRDQIEVDGICLFEMTKLAKADTCYYDLTLKYAKRRKSVQYPTTCAKS